MRRHRTGSKQIVLQQKLIKDNEKNLEKKLLKFKSRVLNSKLEFYNLLTRICKNKKNFKIAGISAPSRSTTLINYLGLDENIIEKQNLYYFQLPTFLYYQISLNTNEQCVFFIISSPPPLYIYIYIYIYIFLFLLFI